MELKESVSSHNKRSHTVHHSRCVVDAFVIQVPDLALVTRVQNLVSFFLDTINSLLIADDNRDVFVKQIVNCVDHFKSVKHQKADLFDSEIQRLLIEIVEEGDRYCNSLSALSNKSDLSISSSDIEVTAQSFQLQWLGVCLLEELKKTFLKK